MLLPWGSALPWREQLYIQFESDFLHIKLYGLGWLTRPLVRQFSLPVVTKRHGVALEQQNLDRSKNDSWRNAFSALQQLLPEITQRSTQLHLIVGNSFVRFVTLPWQPTIATKEEKQAYLDYHFQQAYGETTAQWHTQMQPTQFGHSSLVSAMPRGLMEAFGSMALPKITLASIVPSMLSALSDDSAPTEDKWFIDTSRHTVTVGLWRDRQLQFVHTHHRQEFLSDPFRLYVQREAVRLGDRTLESLPVIPLITQPTLDDALTQWDKALSRFAHAKGE